MFFAANKIPPDNCEENGRVLRICMLFVNVCFSSVVRQIQMRT